jgi:hypothetical protein
VFEPATLGSRGKHTNHYTEETGRLYEKEYNLKEEVGNVIGES